MPIAAYLGNEKLKPSGTVLGFTTEQLQELNKCKFDPIYFINNYVKIIHVDLGLVPFSLYPYQEKMVETFHNNRFVIMKCPRQIGKTTTSIGYILHYIVFNDNVRVALLANKGQTARNELLARLQQAYENLPQWMQQGIVAWNKGSLELENGSKVLAAATSSTAIRGGTYNIIFLDEFAHIMDSVAEDFFTSAYPTISSGKTTKIIIVSTPKGMNMFYRLWMEAEKGKSKFIPFSIDWRDRPGYDQEWYETTIANIGEELFAQEFCCEFFGSSHTLISGSKLKMLAASYKDALYRQDGLDVYQEPIVQRHTDPKGNIIASPNKYVVVADTAKGKFLDYSSFIVVDITEIPYKVVAKYRNNAISPIVYPDVLYNIAKKYNEAFILMEINDAGNQVATALALDLDYENLLKVSPNGRGGQHLSTGYGKSTVQYGLNMTNPVKKTGCANLKAVLERDKVLVPDFDIIQELTTFISVGNTFKADEGKHDDLVMCLVMLSWMIQDKYFRELVDVDLREKMRKDHEAELEYTRLPFGIFSDGIHDRIEPIKFNNDPDIWFKPTDWDHFKEQFPLYPSPKLRLK